MARLAYTVRVGGLRQWVLDDVRQRHGALRDERRDALELAPVAIYFRPQRFGVRSRRGRRRAGRDDGEAAAALQYREAPHRYVAAHGIEHRIDAFNELREILRAVIDDFVSTEATHIVVIRRAR